jgi:hypothetical protein
MKRTVTADLPETPRNVGGMVNSSLGSVTLQCDNRPYGLRGTPIRCPDLAPFDSGPRSPAPTWPRFEHRRLQLSAADIQEGLKPQAYHGRPKFRDGSMISAPDIKATLFGTRGAALALHSEFPVTLCWAPSARSSSGRVPRGASCSEGPKQMRQIVLASSPYLAGTEQAVRPGARNRDRTGLRESRSDSTASPSASLDRRSRAQPPEQHLARPRCTTAVP